MSKQLSQKMKHYLSCTRPCNPMVSNVGRSDMTENQHFQKQLVTPTWGERPIWYQCQTLRIRKPHVHVIPLAYHIYHLPSLQPDFAKLLVQWAVYRPLVQYNNSIGLSSQTLAPRLSLQNGSTDSWSKAASTTTPWSNILDQGSVHSGPLQNSLY